MPPPKSEWNWPLTCKTSAPGWASRTRTTELGHGLVAHHLGLVEAGHRGVVHRPAAVRAAHRGHDLPEPLPVGVVRGLDQRGDLARRCVLEGAHAPTPDLGDDGLRSVGGDDGDVLRLRVLHQRPIVRAVVGPRAGGFEERGFVRAYRSNKSSSEG